MNYKKFLFCEITFSTSFCMEYTEIGSGFKCNDGLYKGELVTPVRLPNAPPFQ